MYTVKTAVRLHDTDAAGLLFFGHQFKIVHDCYESFMQSHAVSFHTILHERDYLLPIVHAESDYLAALAVGDPLSVELACELLGNTSFTLAYAIYRDNEVVGRAKTVHVCTDAQTNAKRSLPDELRSALEPHLITS